VVVGGGAFELAGPDRILRDVGLRADPVRSLPASHWPIGEGALVSSHLPAPAAWAMARPPGDAPLDGALVCLHGQGGDERFPFDVVRVHDVVAESGLRLGVAAVDGGTTSYWHARADGSDAGRMVLDDFVPLVRERLGTDRVAVIGWSMGGFGALRLAQESPSTFDAVVACSPALWREVRESPFGAFDGADDFAATNLFAHHDHLDPRRIRVDCGEADSFVVNARAFARALGPRATSTFAPGGHDALFWRWVAPREVAFVGRQLRV